jgi:hypothetical protein
MSQYRLRCGTTRRVAGDWNGRVAPLHFDYLELPLTQDGKVIRGTARYEALPSSEEGYVSFYAIEPDAQRADLIRRNPPKSGWKLNSVWPHFDPLVEVRERPPSLLVRRTING